MKLSATRGMYHKFDTDCNELSHSSNGHSVGACRRCSPQRDADLSIEGTREGTIQKSRSGESLWTSRGAATAAVREVLALRVCSASF